MNQLKEVVNAVLEQQKLQLAPSTYDARKNYLKHLVVRVGRDGPFRVG